MKPVGQRKSSLINIRAYVCKISLWEQAGLVKSVLLEWMRLVRIPLGAQGDLKDSRSHTTGRKCVFNFLSITCEVLKQNLV